MREWLWLGLGRWLAGAARDGALTFLPTPTPTLLLLLLLLGQRHRTQGQQITYTHTHTHVFSSLARLGGRSDPIHARTQLQKAGSCYPRDTAATAAAVSASASRAAARFSCRSRRLVMIGFGSWSATAALITHSIT